MLDRLPNEIVSKIAQNLAQEDKVALTYVSKKVYGSIIPTLYRNLFLNERYYFPSDFDNSLGTHKWSVLYFKYAHDSSENGRNLNQKSLAKLKFQYLVRSLKKSPEKLCPLIQRVHCTWHLDEDVMTEFISLLIKYDNNLTEFENYIRDKISNQLVRHSYSLQTLTLPPPDILPLNQSADLKYYKKMKDLLKSYNLNQIKKLNIHVNACKFFPKLNQPLKIKELCLNLRPDTCQIDEINHFKYSDIFDINSLKELEVLSWYGEYDPDIDIYDLWNLNDFLLFKNIENLSFFSLFANMDYIKDCIMNFNKLKRLKIDFMFEVPLEKSIIDLMAIAPCHKTIEYLDIKFTELVQYPLLLIDESDELTQFIINMSCHCDECQNTLTNIIQRKFFPSNESYVIKDFNDVERRNFILQMFKLYPIVPYSHYFDIYPSIGFYSRPIEEFVKTVNYLLGCDNKLDNDQYVTSGDIVKLYHCYIHSLKKTLDYFIVRFPNLKYLIMNDLPTMVIQYDEQQKCNVPIFHNYNYKSNQVYELINNESLFD